MIGGKERVGSVKEKNKVIHTERVVISDVSGLLPVDYNLAKSYRLVMFNLLTYRVTSIYSIHSVYCL